MFTAEIEYDKKTRTEQVRFLLTQGDTATIKSTPTDDNGELVDIELVDKCLFKLADYDDNEIFVKEFTPDSGLFTITLETEETTLFPADTLKYEVEYTFLDGTVNTPNKWYFEITDQIRKAK